MKYRIAIIGPFGTIRPSNDGQTVKCQQLCKALQRNLGNDSVLIVDKQIAKKHPIRFLFQIIYACRNSESLIMLPAQNTLLLYPWICKLLRRKRTKLFYSVIGGWLPILIEKHPITERIIKEFDGIWAETTVMKNALEKRGFNNVTVVPNFKDLSIISKDELKNNDSYPLQLSIFSRVMEEKGIEDAINAVNTINEEKCSTVLTLDICGPVDPAYTERFSEIRMRLPNTIKYCGSVPPLESTNLLKKYFALLFPTRFATEGIPGTIVDAYTAGVPVISAKWNSFADVVDDGKTGLGYEQFCYEDLLRVLRNIVDNPSQINAMRENCLKKAEQYMPEVAIEQILKLMDIRQSE